MSQFCNYNTRWNGQRAESCHIPIRNNNLCIPLLTINRIIFFFIYFHFIRRIISVFSHDCLFRIEQSSVNEKIVNEKNMFKIHVLANGCNNSQQCWYPQRIVGGIQPIRPSRPYVMRLHGPNNVGRAVQLALTLLRYASAITEQKKCLELLAEKFDRFQTAQQLPIARNNMQQGL